MIDELRAAVHSDPRGVAVAAAELLPATRAADDAAAVSRILSVLGRARRSLGEIALAESDLDEAIAVALAAGEDDLAADAHVGLAGVLSFAGRSAEAFAHLDEADRLGHDLTRAHASLQRAIIEQRIGHMREALSRYDAALPTLRRLDRSVDVALVLMNRGVIRLQSGACAQAVADLTESRELFDREGQAFGVAQAEHNLGWAYTRWGDLPRALRHLDGAAERFHALGHAALEVEIDRVEVLLAAGLYAEAAEIAADTATRLSLAGNHSQAAETWLLGARAAALDGDRSAAAAHAERARRLFADQGATGWERAARLEMSLSGDAPADARQLRALADGLAEVGNARGAAAALALACLAACRTGDVAVAAELEDECARQAARLGVFDVRMLSRHAAATVALTAGDDARARRHVRAGLADLRRHQASLAATDAQAAVSVHAADLARLGLRLGLRTGSPAAALAWMERVRGGLAGSPAPRPPDDDDLAVELTALRGIVAQVRSCETDGQDATDLLQAQAELERSIQRRRLRTSGDGRDRVEGGRSRRRPTVRTLHTALGAATLACVSEVDSRLAAVTITGEAANPPATIDLVDLGPAAEANAAAETVGAMLRALATAPEPDPRLADRLRRALAVLDRILTAAVVGTGPVVLVVPPAMHVVPWHLSRSLAGRPVTVAPSVRWWYQAEARAGGAATHALVVAGPGLAEAETEAKSVEALYPVATLLSGSEAISDAVLAGMAEADVAHVACHARIRHDNALWSSLELADGPLYVHDLERLGRTPRVVVLSGCETGLGIRAGEELLGLATALLARGTRSLVASVCPLPDTPATRDAMTSLHERISAGLSPSAALAELSGAAMWDWPPPTGYLTCFGAY